MDVAAVALAPAAAQEKEWAVAVVPAPAAAALADAAAASPSEGNPGQRRRARAASGGWPARSGAASGGPAPPPPAASAAAPAGCIAFLPTSLAVTSQREQAALLEGRQQLDQLHDADGVVHLSGPPRGEQRPHRPQQVDVRVGAGEGLHRPLNF